MYKVFNNVLSEGDLARLRKQAEGQYKTIDTGYADILCRAPDTRINNLLLNFIKREVDPKLVELQSFLRLNTPTKDTSFRVHADKEPLNDDRRCLVAAVFYLYDDESGTALFEHPDHGKSVGSQYVFTEDDGKWSPYMFCKSTANRLFVYDARLFHGRQPWKVNQDRIVLVKFLR